MEAETDLQNEKSPPLIKEVKAQRKSEANNQILSAEINTGESSKLVSGSQGYIMSPVHLNLKDISIPNLAHKPRLIQPNLTN